ncbi:unnamed protein product [Thelazia callipaeda]|uniref:Peptidase_S24 domain-containing protein n=1 Tax=Thelazia callipaeda TaxID=103827 RepID=A0A0N5CSE0_THECL|nr:unnamed protein product [Thelazia callipaeda]
MNIIGAKKRQAFHTQLKLLLIDDPITVASIEFYARNGASMYPIDLTNLAVIKLESYNNGDLVEKDNVDVDIYTYVKYGNQWTWKNVIPEGFRFLLRNLNGCAIAHNCPLTKGELQLALALDLSKYSFLFRFIDKNAAHQFVIKMHDAKNDEQICCQTVQLRIV